jgi:hypothetical protein
MNTRKIGLAAGRARRYLLAILLLLVPLVAVPAATPAAATTFFVPGVDMGMDANMARAGNWLSWSTVSCSGGRTYNWYAAGVNNLTDNMPYYPYYYGQNISSMRNLSSNCNRMHLTSGPWYGAPQGVGWTGCVRPGYAVGRFGYPWNDNVQQIGLSWDPACG